MPWPNDRYCFCGAWTETLTVPKRSGQSLIFNDCIMRKSSLNQLNLGADNLLHKEQLKSVLGGYAPKENDWPCYDSGCLSYCGDQATWLWENSSMTDPQVQSWYMGCLDSCCNG